MSINVASQLAVQAIWYNKALKDLRKDLIGEKLEYSLVFRIREKLDNVKQEMLCYYDIDRENLIHINIEYNNGDILLYTDMYRILKNSNVEEKTVEHILGLLTG
nr:MAG TPA: hypothetical protein [Caudoviricetes sp.]